METADAVQTSAPAAARPARHRWLKVRLHVRICLKCGTGKVNAKTGSTWRATFHGPDGRSQVLSHVPPCAPGPFTETYLAKYSDRIRGSVIDART